MIHLQEYNTKIPIIFKRRIWKTEGSQKKKKLNKNVQSSIIRRKIKYIKKVFKFVWRFTSLDWGIGVMSASIYTNCGREKATVRKTEEARKSAREK